MADEIDRQALLTTLTTEHFGLQGARGSTIAESSARAAMYLGSLSASLVSLGFVAQTSATGDTFRVFALVVLPTLFVLGVFTFVRLVESAVEDIFYGRAINRIRSYYHHLAGPEARYFMPCPTTTFRFSETWALRPRGGSCTSRRRARSLSSTALSEVRPGNRVLGRLRRPLGTAAVVGCVFAIVSVTAHEYWLRRRLERGVAADVLFPSPAA